MAVIAPPRIWVSGAKAARRTYTGLLLRPTPVTPPTPQLGVPEGGQIYPLGFDMRQPCVVVEPPDEEEAVTFSELALSLSPRLYHRYGEAPGPPAPTTAVDASGLGHHGTYVNGPTLGVAGLLAGDTDKALRIVGASQQYVNVGNIAALQLARPTYMALCTFEGALLNLWHYDSTDSPVLGRGFHLKIMADGHATLWLGKGDGSLFSNITGPTVIPSGRTVLVAGTFDGAEMRLYVYWKNGLALGGGLEGALANSKPISYGNPIGLRMGNFLHGGLADEYGTGVVDEGLIFGEALTQAQIEGLARKAFGL